jgi:hypothetical protein
VPSRRDRAEVRLLMVPVSPRKRHVQDAPRHRTAVSESTRTARNQRARSSLGGTPCSFPDSGRRQRRTDRANPDPDCGDPSACWEATSANDEARQELTWRARALAQQDVCWRGRSRLKGEIRSLRL